MIAQRQRKILEPLEANAVNNRMRARIKHMTLSELVKDPKEANHNGYLNLQLIRIFANGRNKNQSKVQYSKAKDTSKTMNSSECKRLCLSRVIRNDTPTSELLYCLEDNINHTKLLN